jgi:transcription initiation factor TFIIB
MEDAYTAEWTLMKTLATKVPETDSAEHCDNQQQCPYCLADNSVHAVDGCVTCTACGTFIERIVDCGAEWRVFGSSNRHGGGDMTRCGLPFDEMLPNASYSVQLAGGSGKGSSLVKRCHKWSSAFTYQEKTLYTIFEDVAAMSNVAGIPMNIVDDAKALYKNVTELKGILRGAKRRGLIAATLYLSCKSNGAPRSTKEIAKMFGVDTLLVNRGCKAISQVVPIPTTPSEAVDFIARFASRLLLGHTEQLRCRSVMLAVNDLGISFHNTPPTVAAACIQFTCMLYEMDLDSARLSDISGVANTTITKCFNHIASFQEAIADCLVTAARSV